MDWSCWAPRDIGSFALSGAGVSFDVLRDFLTSKSKEYWRAPAINGIILD